VTNLLNHNIKSLQSHIQGFCKLACLCLETLFTRALSHTIASLSHYNTIEEELISY
jgi:hypothetical protein